MNGPETDDAIVAYLDGAMGEPDRTAFAARCAGDPELARRVQAHRWLSRNILAAFGPAPTDAITPELLNHLGLAAGRSAGTARLPSALRRVIMFAAPATALAAGLGIGVWLGGLRSADGYALTVQRNGHVIAGAALSQALSNRLTGEPGPIRIAMTIRTAEGPCRTFVAGKGVNGLACRSRGKWEVPVMVGQPAPTAAMGEYRLAGGDVSPTVMAEVDRRIIGDPVSLEEEKALQRHGWR